MNQIFTDATPADIAATLSAIVRREALDAIERIESEDETMALVFVVCTGDDPFDTVLGVAVVGAPDQEPTDEDSQVAFDTAWTAATESYGERVRRFYTVVWDTDEGRSELAEYGVIDFDGRMVVGRKRTEWVSPDFQRRLREWGRE